MAGLPPLILELRARSGEFLAAMQTAKGEVRSLGAESEVGAGRMAGAGKVAKAAFLGIAGATAIVGVESVKQAIEFQKSTTLLQTAGGESEKNMKMVSAGILSVSNDTGISAQKMAEGMYIVEKSGNRGAAGLTVLRAAAEGATAEGVGVNVMATALTSVMASFNIPAKDAAKAMSALDRGAGLAKTTMADFAGALSSVMPAANAAHMSLPGVLANIATLTQHGTTAAEATQELAHTIQKLNGTPTIPMQNAMNQLGIKSQDLRTAMAGPGGLAAAVELVQTSIRQHLGPAGNVVVDSFKQSAQATSNLQVELSKMSGGLKANSQGLLDGSMTVKGYLKAAGGMDAQQYRMAQGFAATAKQAQGFNTLLTKGNQVTRNAAGALKDVMGDSVSFKTALMLTGTATDKNSSSLAYNTKAIKDITEQYNKGGAHIATYAETQATVAVQAAKLKTGLENIGITIGSFLLPFVMTLVKHLQVVVQWLGDNWMWLGKLALGITAVGIAMKILNAVMHLNPFSLVVLGIAALVAGFVTLWNKSAGFRDFWIGLWDKIKTPVTKAWDAIKSASATAWDAIKSASAKALGWFTGTAWPAMKRFGQFLGQVFRDAWPYVQAAWANIVAGVQSAVDWITNTAWPAIQRFGQYLSRVFQDAIPHIRAAWNGIVVGVQIALNWVAGTAWPALQRFGAFLGRVFQDAVPHIRTAWSNIVAGVQSALGWFTGTAWPAVKTFAGHVGQAFKDAWPHIKAAWDKIVSVVKTAIGWIVNTAWPALQRFGAFLAGVFVKVWPVIKGAWDKIVAGVRTAIGWFTGTAWPAIQKFAGFLGRVFKDAASIVKAVWDGIVSVVQKVVGWFTNTALPAVRAFVGFVVSAFKAAQPILKMVWDAIVSIIGSAINFIKNVIWPIFKQIIDSIVKIVKDMWPVIQGIWKNIVDVFKAAWPAIKVVMIAIGVVIAVAVAAIVAAFIVVAAAIAALVYVFSKMVPVIKGVIQAVADIISGFARLFGDVFRGVAQVFTDIMNTIVGVFKGVWQTIRGIWEVFSGIFTGNWSQVWNGLKDVFGGIWNTITSVFQGVWNTISSAASYSWNVIKDVIVAPIQAASDVLSGIVSGIVQFFTDAWNKISGIVNSIQSAASSATSAINPFSGSSSGVSGFLSGKMFGLHAQGGPLDTGWNIVGEQGPEMIYHGGGQSMVYSNPSTPGGTPLPASFGGSGNTSNQTHNNNTQHITVQVATNASPAKIAAELGWKLRAMA